MFVSLGIEYDADASMWASFGHLHTSGGTAERKMLRTRSKCTISGIGFGSKYLANLKVSGQKCRKELVSVTV